MRIHTLRETHKKTYTVNRQMQTHSNTYSCWQGITKALEFCILVELSFSVMEVWRIRLMTVASTFQLLRSVSCQREWMRKLRQPWSPSTLPYNSNYGFLTLLGVFIPNIWLLRWWKLEGITSLLSLRWKGCEISCDLISCHKFKFTSVSSYTKCKPNNVVFWCRLCWQDGRLYCSWWCSVLTL